MSLEQVIRGDITSMQDACTRVVRTANCVKSTLIVIDAQWRQYTTHRSAKVRDPFCIVFIVRLQFVCSISDLAISMPLGLTIGNAKEVSKLMKPMPHDEVFPLHEYSFFPSCSVHYANVWYLHGIKDYPQ